MLMFLEQGKRGGVCGVMGTRHVKANNKYLKEFDPTKETNFLVYVDANNLYGLAMSQYLPTGGFKWWNDEKIYNSNSNIQHFINNLLSIPENNSQGYYLEVDLQYPRNIKEHTKNFPIAPIKRKIQEYELSDYQKFLIKDQKRIPQ